ncbi:hypothetical protein Tco_0779422 [Tanacetum coccineum]
MEKMTSICDMVGQYMQKKEEEKRITEEQAAKDRYWKIPICYDDDEDYTIEIAPVLLTKEPVKSLNNPTPSSDVMTKSSSTFLNLFLEETNTFDNSSPESETFCFDLQENSSGSTNNHRPD